MPRVYAAGACIFLCTPTCRNCLGIVLITILPCDLEPCGMAPPGVDELGEDPFPEQPARSAALPSYTVLLITNAYGEFSLLVVRELWLVSPTATEIRVAAPGRPRGSDSKCSFYFHESVFWRGPDGDSGWDRTPVMRLNLSFPCELPRADGALGRSRVIARRRRSKRSAPPRRECASRSPAPWDSPPRETAKSRRCCALAAIRVVAGGKPALADPRLGDIARLFERRRAGDARGRARMESR